MSGPSTGCEFRFNLNTTRNRPMRNSLMLLMLLQAQAGVEVASFDHPPVVGRRHERIILWELHVAQVAVTKGLLMHPKM